MLDCLPGVAYKKARIPLWDSAPAHSPFGKEINPFSQEDARFSGRWTLTCWFHFIQRHTSLVLSNSSLTIRWRAQPFLSGRCPFLRAFFSTCFYIILRWLSLIYYSPILPINSLFRHILTMAFFYSDTPFLSKIYYTMNGLFL